MARSNMGVGRNNWSLVHKSEELMIKWREYIEYLYEFDQRPCDREINDEAKVLLQNKKWYCHSKASGIDELPIELFESLGNSGVKR